MKKAQREVFITLAAEIDWEICAFCRHHYCEGYPCEDGWSECRHPLEVVQDMTAYGIAPTDDCWGFAPMVTVSDMADIVGLILSRFDPAQTQWWKEKDGAIIVQGRNRQVI
jgi:hypothetical protein